MVSSLHETQRGLSRRSSVRSEWDATPRAVYQTSRLRRDVVVGIVLTTLLMVGHGFIRFRRSAQRLRSRSSTDMATSGCLPRDPRQLRSTTHHLGGVGSHPSQRCTGAIQEDDQCLGS